MGANPNQKERGDKSLPSLARLSVVAVVVRIAIGFGGVAEEFVEKRLIGFDLFGRLGADRLTQIDRCCHVLGS